MADKFGLSRPGGNVGRAIESDLFIIGGIKTISDATDLTVGTYGAGSNLNISVDAGRTGALNCQVGSGGMTLFTSGGMTATTADIFSILMNASDPSDKTCTISASNVGGGKGILTLQGSHRVQMNIGGTQHYVKCDSVTGLGIESLVAINIGSEAGYTSGPIRIGVGDTEKSIYLGNLVDATSVSIQSGTGDTSLKSVQDISFDARSCLSPLTYNQVGDLDLNPTFLATSIVGAFNELKSSITTTITVDASGTTNIVDIIPTTGFGGAEWFYTIYSDNNDVRSGKIGCAWESVTPSVKFWEFGTTDIGTTDDISIEVIHTGTHIQLIVSNSGSAAWTFVANRYIAGSGSVGTVVPSGWVEVTSILTASGSIETFEPISDGMAIWNLVVTDEQGNTTERTLTAAWSVYSGESTYSVSSSPDIGDTSPVDLEVNYVAGTLSLDAVISSGTWTIAGTKYMRSV